ncbi:hypothetical protein D3C75_709690 [compost metagenome]
MHMSLCNQRVGNVCSRSPIRHVHFTNRVSIWRAQCGLQGIRKNAEHRMTHTGCNGSGSSPHHARSGCAAKIHHTGHSRLQTQILSHCRWNMLGGLSYLGPNEKTINVLWAQSSVSYSECGNVENHSERGQPLRPSYRLQLRDPHNRSVPPSHGATPDI